MPGSRTLLRPATGNALAGSATTFRGLSACRSLARWMMPGWHLSACPGSPGSPGIRSAADHPGDVLEFLPQRPPRQVAGGSLQCPLVPRRRQPRPADMVRQHEASVVDPLGRRPRSQREHRVRDTLPEPAKTVKPRDLRTPQGPRPDQPARRTTARCGPPSGSPGGPCEATPRPPDPSARPGSRRQPSCAFRRRSLPGPGLHQPGCRSGWRLTGRMFSRRRCCWRAPHQAQLSPGWCGCRQAHG